MRALTKTVQHEVVVERGTCVVSIYQERRLKKGIDPTVEGEQQGSAPSENYEVVTLVDAIADPSIENGPRANHVELDSLGFTAKEIDQLFDAVEELCARALKKSHGLTG